jgi:hypothetical protein
MFQSSKLLFSVRFSVGELAKKKGSFGFLAFGCVSAKTKYANCGSGF